MESDDEGTGILVQNGTHDWKGNAALKRKTGKWAGSFPVLVLEAAETTTFFAVSANLVTYMTIVLHQGVAKSARDVNNWSGTLFVSSVIGAFMSDSYWGQYKTISISILLYSLGLTSLTISASMESLRPPQCTARNHSCPQASTAQVAMFFISLYVIAVSCGSLKANLVSFGADQFDEADEKERIQKHSFFNWFVCSIDAGNLIAATALFYVEDHVGFGWGFGILLVGIFIAAPLFFIQTRRYRYKHPEGSQLTKVAQVFVAAIRKRHIQGNQLHEEDGKGKEFIRHTEQFLFLDKAAVKVEGSVQSPWTLCTVTRVEEVKLLLRMIPLWFSMLFLGIAASQALTFFVTQGTNMDNQLGNFKVPPASMLVFSGISQIVFLAFYDRLLVPFLKNYTRNERGISLLQKIGLGMAFNNIGILVAALVEMKRRNAVPRLSIFWLVPQYWILGIGEALASAGLFEFFHDQASDGMKSLGTSFALLNFGVGSFASSLLITCVKAAAPSWLQDDINKGHLDYFYWLLVVFLLANLALIYVPLALWYSYKTCGDDKVIEEVKHQMIP